MKIIKILLLALLLVGCSNMTYQQMNMEEAIEIMNKTEDYILLDVRTIEEYNEGHLPNARCYPNEEIDTQILDVIYDKDVTIYVYCRSGNRSKQASEKLVNLGYTNVIEIGGIMDYKGELEY